MTDKHGGRPPSTLIRLSDFARRANCGSEPPGVADGKCRQALAYLQGVQWQLERMATQLHLLPLGQILVQSPASHVA